MRSGHHDKNFRRSAICLMAVLTACAPVPKVSTGDRTSPPDAAANILGTWSLVGINNAPTDAQVSISFRQDGNFAARVSCNDLSGAFVLVPPLINFSDGRITERGCIGDGPDIQKVEQVLLKKSLGYSLRGNDLELRGTSRLLFSRMP